MKENILERKYLRPSTCRMTENSNPVTNITRLGLWLTGGEHQAGTQKCHQGFSLTRYSKSKLVPSNPNNERERKCQNIYGTRLSIILRRLQQAMLTQELHRHLNSNPILNLNLNHNQNHNPYQYQLSHMGEAGQIRLSPFFSVRKIQSLGVDLTLSAPNITQSLLLQRPRV